MNFDLSILFAVLAGILLLIGLIGTVAPIIPGPPVAWAGLLLAHFSSYSGISIPTLIVTGVFAAAVTFLDNLFPSLMTKRYGGTKWGITGCTIGIIIGFFLGPVFLIVAPFFGALLGELLHDFSDKKRAFKSALGAFAGFLLGTGIKIITVSFFIWIFVMSLLKNH